jgi:hypothetical protein
VAWPGGGVPVGVALGEPVGTPRMPGPFTGGVPVGVPFAHGPRLSP